MVFLKKEGLVIWKYKKLQPKKYGPHKFPKKTTDNAYVIDLLDDWRILKAFNVVDLYKHFPSKYLEINSWSSFS